MTYPKALLFLYRRSRRGFLGNAFRTLRYYMANKSIISHYRAVARGLDNISIAKNNTLVLGMFPNNFSAPSDVTFVNAMGRLHVEGYFEIGRGARISIGKNAMVSLGSGFINNNSVFAIEHKLSIGKDCAIGWNVQIIDDDYHTLTFEGQKPAMREGITIGDHVWIGSNVSILKNVTIPDGCVISSGSLVNQKFSETNCLIAGSPAKVIKRNVQWQ